MTNLYVKYKPTGDWEKTTISNQQSIIALATAPKEVQAKSRDRVNRSPATASAPPTCKVGPIGGGNKALPAWHVTKTGNTYTHNDDTTWVWC